MTESLPTSNSWPEDQCGAVVGSQVVLGRSERAAVVLHVLLGYPAGISAYLGVHLREPADSRAWIDDLRERDRPGGFRIAFAFDAPAEPRPLRTSFGSQQPWWSQQGASGNDRSYTGWLWIAPYPPDSSLALSCSWKNHRIDRTDSTLPVPTPDEIANRTTKFWKS